jgi:tripartite-type tricarboxylate transporter receptor subunit TctC
LESPFRPFPEEQFQFGHIEGGKIRAFAVTSAQREPSLPGVPTVAETVKGYEATAWFGVGMPKGSPREAIDRINAEVNRALSDPKMLERGAGRGGLRRQGRVAGGIATTGQFRKNYF